MSAPRSTSIAIVGGGPAGLALARLLTMEGIRCVVFEARSAGAAAADRRSIALSWRSHLALARLGVDVPSLPGVAPIRAIHVSHAGQPGRTMLEARETGVESFGFVVGYGTLVAALSEPDSPLWSVAHDTPVTARRDEGSTVSVRTPQDYVAADAIVIADGAGALLAECGFETTTHEYGVHALVGTVQVDHPVSGLAFERFTRHGPLAMLPAADGYSLVWSLPQADAESLRDAPQDVVCERLQTAFGWRLGRVREVGARAAYPLVLKRTRPTVRDRIAVVGNAAQTLHPVAGQGLNLALRDVWSLGAAVAEQPHALPEALARHDRDRQSDRSRTIGFTDALARAFTADPPGAGLLRGALLSGLDMSPPMRRTFARLLSTTPMS
jgi:2-octaprenyl-6-methoxyphenol hydroxylase